MKVSYPWIQSWNINYQLGIDGLSLPLVVLTSLLGFLAVMVSWHIEHRAKLYFSMLLLLETGVLGVFTSLDFLLFFLFWEVELLPMYLLIAIWGSSGEVKPQGIFGWAFKRTGVGTKEYAAMKLTLYLLLGSAFILVGILALYTAAGSTSFSFLDLQKVKFDPHLQSWVFLFFWVGFGVGAALVIIELAIESISLLTMVSGTLGAGAGIFVSTGVFNTGHVSSQHIGHTVV